MVCNHCGTRSATTEVVCPSCGQRMAHRPPEVATAVLTPPPVTNGIPADQTRLLPASEAETFQPWTSSSDATVLGPVPESEGLTRTLIPDSHTEPVNERNTAILPKPAGPRQKEGPLEIGQAFGTPLPHHQSPGGWRHGRRLSGVGCGTGVSVAVKVIRPEIAADPTAAAEIERRFKRELVLARQVTDRQCGPHSRSRRNRRHQVHHHGVRRRAGPLDDSEEQDKLPVARGAAARSRHRLRPGRGA